jgi:tetratricopeptide (TPR) repeat protein
MRAAGEAKLPAIGLTHAAAVQPDERTLEEQADRFCVAGQLLAQSGKVDEAIGIFQRIEENVPSDRVTWGEALLSRAEILFRQEAYDESLELCRELMEGTGSETIQMRALSLMGRCHEAMGDLERALRLYEGEYRVTAEWRRAQ